LSTASSLPSGPFADSVIGTALAVLIAAVIMYQLIRARPQLPAGRPSSVRRKKRSTTEQDRGEAL
jgi:hypothetical protein